MKTTALRLFMFLRVSPTALYVSICLHVSLSTLCHDVSPSSIELPVREQLYIPKLYCACVRDHDYVLDLEKNVTL